MKGVADCHRHGRAAHGRCKGAHGVSCVVYRSHRHRQKGDVELCTKGINNGSDQKGTEKSLGHGAQSINSISFYRNDNILPL